MSSSFFADATEVMTRYALYHRDRRNIATHFVGVPLIVFAVAVLLARPSVSIGMIALTPTWVLIALTTVWYLTRGNPTLGLLTSAANAILAWLAHPLGAAPTSVWLGVGLSAFVIGWAIQFVGHYFEGKKPAFVDDLAGLIVAPMFLVAEALFAGGWNPALRETIERRAGPLRSGPATA